MARHNDLIAELEPTITTAGILVRHPGGGVWMCATENKEGTVYADFGGKRVPEDKTLWDTAVRECLEEGGLYFGPTLLTSSTPILRLGNKTTKVHGVVFVLESTQTPRNNGDNKIVGYRFFKSTLDGVTLHPRLKYSTGVVSQLNALL